MRQVGRSVAADAGAIGGVGIVVLADLDTWLSQRPSARRRLIRLPALGTQPPADARDGDLFPRFQRPTWFVADDQRWQLARRALTDDTLPARDRIAIALLLLYGQPAARITRLTRLTRAAIHADGEHVRLRLGQDHVVLPPPWDGLIQRLPEQPPVGMAAHLAADDQWLFPGRRPGQPVHPTTLGRRLRELGIEPRGARNTALLQLRAELPSLVRADLLGIRISTAERWNAAAGARWTNYAAARSHADGASFCGTRVKKHVEPDINRA